MACRVEQIPAPGDFQVFEISDQSIVVVRQEDGSIRAFHNACRHRGTELVCRSSGTMHQFRCPNHAWTYALDGTLLNVLSPSEFPTTPDWSLFPIEMVYATVDVRESLKTGSAKDRETIAALAENVRAIREMSRAKSYIHPSHAHDEHGNPVPSLLTWADATGVNRGGAIECAVGATNCAAFGSSAA